MQPALSHIRNWVFDLDNTLYPASGALWTQINAKIGQYVETLLNVGPEEAHRIQKGYFHSHGTTLRGLMSEHDIDPHHYLHAVHEVDLSSIEANFALTEALVRLPGRKLIFTNANAPYAVQVLERLGMADTFEGVHDIHSTDYTPKPDPKAYEGLCAAWGIDPRESLFVEDMARNLKPAKAIGMTTVWIDNGSEQTDDPDRSYIDYTITDLGAWLHDILEDQA